jgi:hypothetical protein
MIYKCIYNNTRERKKEMIEKGNIFLSRRVYIEMKMRKCVVEKYISM